MQRTVKPTNQPLTNESIQNVLQYINTHWSALTTQNKKDTGTLIGVPNPYIVPSAQAGLGFAFKEQYYWDTYFIMLGLHDKKHKKLVRGMIDNFVALYERFHVIPNASRFYFLSRSQPPLLTAMANLYIERFGLDSDWYDKVMRTAEHEYNHVWMSQEHPHWRRVGDLNRYYDINALHDLAEAESGWDMTPRFSRKCLDHHPVDLNSLLYKYEQDFAAYYRQKGDKKTARAWDTKAKARATAMQNVMWSKRRKFYFDYNFHDKRRSLTWSLAGFYPLWAGMVSAEQAAVLVRQLKKFEREGGLTTTTRPIIDKSIFGSVKTQWAYPNGWAPLQWITIMGLENYGYSKDAQRIAKKWLNTCANWYEIHGEMAEKYNVVSPHKLPLSGVYPDQTGFGWTNGVFTDLAKRYAQQD